MLRETRQAQKKAGCMISVLCEIFSELSEAERIIAVMGTEGWKAKGKGQQQTRTLITHCYTGETHSRDLLHNMMIIVNIKGKCVECFQNTIIFLDHKMINVGEVVRNC